MGTLNKGVQTLSFLFHFFRINWRVPHIVITDLISPPTQDEETGTSLSGAGCSKGRCRQLRRGASAHAWAWELRDPWGLRGKRAPRRLVPSAGQHPPPQVRSPRGAASSQVPGGLPAARPQQALAAGQMREAAATGRDAAGLSTRCPAPRPPASRPGPRRGRCGREVRQRSLGRSGLRPEGRSAGRAQTRGPRPPPLAAGLHPALPARSGPVPPLGRFRFRFPGTVVKENESGRGQALRGCRRGEGRRVRGGRPGAGSREPGPQPPPVEVSAPLCGRLAGSSLRTGRVGRQAAGTPAGRQGLLLGTGRA